jgi:hypothetical protein
MAAEQPLEAYGIEDGDQIDVTMYARRPHFFFVQLFRHHKTGFAALGRSNLRAHFRVPPGNKLVDAKLWSVEM